MPPRVYPRHVIVEAARRWLHGEKLTAIALDLKLSPSYVHKIVYPAGHAYRFDELPPTLRIMLLEKQESMALAHLENIRERLAAAHVNNVNLRKVRTS